jgi:hypothetical protein
MPSVRSLVFKRLAYYSKLVAVILSLGEIMPSYSRYKKKGLVYIIITAPSSRQPSSCFKCTALNIHLSCNIQSVFNTECTCLIAYLYIL